MPCCASRPSCPTHQTAGAWRRLFGVLALLVLLFAGVGGGAAVAAEIGVRDPQLSPSDDAWQLSADFAIALNPRLEEAVNRGVVLHFVVDFELTRARWYWFDAEVVRRSKSFQLSYHALTRQYRLSTGALHQGFASLDEALRVLARLRNWSVVERSELRPDQAYDARLRLRLDLTQMPKPFQVDALANRDWNLASDWARWRFAPGAPAPVQVLPALITPPSPSIPSTVSPPAPAPGEAAVPAGEGK